METNEWKLLDKSWCNLTNYDCSCAGCAVKVSLTFRGTQYSKMAPVKVSKKTASAWWMPPKIVKIILLTVKMCCPLYCAAGAGLTRAKLIGCRWDKQPRYELEPVKSQAGVQQLQTRCHCSHHPITGHKRVFSAACTAAPLPWPGVLLMGSLGIWFTPSGGG